MLKYKKVTIKVITFLFILFTLIELFYYLSLNSSLYGLIYLLINTFIIFLMVPVAYNYNGYYSAVRLSKLIIILLLGIFNSYILNYVVLNNMSYFDNSQLFIDKIFVIKNILKGIIYFFILLFTLFEFKLDKLLVKKFSNKVDKK